MAIICLILNHRLNMWLSCSPRQEPSSSYGWQYTHPLPKLQANQDSKKLTGFLQLRATWALPVILVVMYCCFSTAFSSLPLWNWARESGIAASQALLSRYYSSQFLFLHCSPSTTVQKKKNLSLCYLGNCTTGWQFSLQISKYSADQSTKLLPLQKGSCVTHGLSFHIEAEECCL